MIHLTNITKRFHDITAVDDISLAIETGETFGLLGPNGAGKTTTINLLVGLLAPDSGQIQFDNKNDNNRDRRQVLGVCPQSISLYEELTAEENLTIFGKLYGLGGKLLKERLAACLDLVGLTNRKKSRVKTFSGGMKRRLNLACSLIHEPRLILLDEPTVGVDPQSRNLIFDNIEQLKKSGRTIIYTTHYMEEAERLCDRIAIIDHGKILALDTVSALIDRYGGESQITVKITGGRPDIPGSTFDETNQQLKVLTTQPTEVISRIISAGVGIEALHLERPDLETVFLNLTGRSLRD